MVIQQNRIQGEGAAKGAGGWQEQLSQCSTDARDIVEQNPMLVTLAAFGVGVGIGTLLGHTIAGPSRRHDYLARSVGQRMIDAVKEAMPSSVQQHLPHGWGS